LHGRTSRCARSVLYRRRLGRSGDAESRFDVIDPFQRGCFAQISLGSKADVDKAVAAAKRAFETGFSQTSREERLALLKRIIEVYKKRMKDLALAVSAKWARRAVRPEDCRSASASPISKR
jgi:acyl-CoA reductase-like NAD-dependent aldehyde dehydrogenase